MTTDPQPPITIGPDLPDRRNAELALLCFATAIVGAALVVVELSQQRRLDWDLAGYIAGFFALFISAHLVVRRYARYADPLLLAIVALLNGLGVVMIHRIDLGADWSDIRSDATAQLVWSTVGVLAFVAVLILLKDHRQLSRAGYTCGLLGLILLAIPAVLPASVSEQNGAKIWIRFPSFSIQPAEFSKILLLIFFAAALVSKRRLFSTVGRHALGMDLPRARDLGPLLAGWAIAVGIMVVEKDLGTSLLLYASFLAVVYVATRRVSWLLIGLGLFVVAAGVAYSLFAHVQVRVQTWLDPFADPEGTGYQMVQSLFSFATGGIFGTGLGNGQPGYVPAASTDFIVAAFGEELGLVGLAGLLVLYMIFVERGLRTAIAVRDNFGKLLAAGLAATIGIQLFIVVGGVTRLIPLTGLTTPWLSYGGSSLLANYMLLAILARISHSARKPLTGTPSRPPAPIAGTGTEVMERL